jgi:hypothetical protein
MQLFSNLLGNFLTLTYVEGLGCLELYPIRFVVTCLKIALPPWSSTDYNTPPFGLAFFAFEKGFNSARIKPSSMTLGPGGVSILGLSCLGSEDEMGNG